MIIKVIKDSIIYRGEINALGTEFECDDAVAKSLIERGFATPTSVVITNEIEEDTVEEKVIEHKSFLDAEQLENEFSYQELKKLASDMGLSAKGSKAELIERITAEEVGYELPEEADCEEMPNTDMPE